MNRNSRMSGVDAAANAPMGNEAGASSSFDVDPIAAILQALREQTRKRSILQILGELRNALAGFTAASG
jgi:hypothetical protein